MLLTNYPLLWYAAIDACVLCSAICATEERGRTLNREMPWELG
jgi:hypothetical protein